MSIIANNGALIKGVQGGGALWTPANESLLFHFSADSVISDANGVSQITDLSGNSLHATQSDNALKGVLGTLNSQNVIDLNEDAYDLPDPVSAASNNYFFGISISLNEGNYIIDSVTGRFILGYSSTTSFGFYDGSWKVSPRSSIGFSVITYSLDNAGQADVRINGDPFLTTTYAAKAISGVTRLFNRYTSPFAGNPLVGSFGNMVCKITNKDQTLIEKYEGWAAHKYGLTASLPVNHPYKNNAPTI